MYLSDAILMAIMYLLIVNMFMIKNNGAGEYIKDFLPLGFGVRF